MAHIFKHPTSTHRGILVFTHKEIPYWKQHLPQIIEEVWKIRRSYFIGVHYGVLSNVVAEPFQDFVMGRESTVRVHGRQIFRIPFNSRAFTPVCFQPDSKVKKHWDIINISRVPKVKNLDIFLRAIKQIYLSGRKFRVLLVVPSSSNESPQHAFTNIVQTYHEMFSEGERELFTLMRLSPELSFLGLPQETIAYFYNSSRVFTLLSAAEGESRVIHEALLCGLPVVVYANLQGGGRDYLNNSNSVQFGDFKDVAAALAFAVENHARLSFDPHALLSELREDHTIPKLRDYFREMFALQGESFDGELINLNKLNFRLPAHYFNVPWHLPSGNGITTDIESLEQFAAFRSCLRP